MLNSIFKRAGWPSFFLMAVAIALWFSGLQRLPVVDDVSDRYFQAATTKAGIAFASTRAVNATVSVIQHSELQLEPAGLGVSLALGQVLDPLNDMAERLSNVLFLSLVSLGIQKLAYQVAYELTLPLLSILFIAIAVFRGVLVVTENHQKVLLRLVFIVIFLRLMMPVCAGINAMFHQHYAAPEIEAAAATLKQFNGDFSADAVSESESEPSFWSRTKSIQQDIKNLRESISTIKQRTEVSIKALLQLAAWYIALFLVQALILPISVLIMLRLAWRTL